MRIYIYIYDRLLSYIHIHIIVEARIHIFICAYTKQYTYMPSCLEIKDMYLYIYIFIFIHIYIYIYIYTNLLHICGNSNLEEF